jgi:hypothetical protein
MVRLHSIEKGIRYRYSRMSSVEKSRKAPRDPIAIIILDKLLLHKKIIF